MLRVVVCLTAIAICVVAVPLRAQQAAPEIEVRAGTRVRLDAPGIVGDHMIATVISRTADTLTIASPNASPIAVPTSRITRLEVSRGDSRSAGALHGMKWGVPIGAGFGVLGLFLVDDCDSCGTHANRGAIVPAFAGAGAIYGAIIGSIVQHEQWAPFALAPRVSFDPGMQRGTLALNARF